MKVVILARGLGTRMRAATASTSDLPPEQARAADAGLKALMPVGGAASGHMARPFLDYVIASFADAGYHDIGIVIGPEHDVIRHRYEREVRPARVRLEWAVQQQARGTADAVLAAESWVGGEPFVVANADNLYPVSVLAALRALDGPGLAVFDRRDLIAGSNIPPERIASFAILAVTPEGLLAEITEKPGPEALERAGPNALVSMNCWRFDARIFDACRDVPVSPRGELELPMAVRLAMERGVRFKAVPAEGSVLDLSTRADIAEVSRRLAGRRPEL